MEVDPVQTSISSLSPAPVRTRRARRRRSVSPPGPRKQAGIFPPKRKHRQDPVNDKDDEDASTVGCLSFLKKISCTLSCGGTTCSVKETEPLSSSSSTGSSHTTTGSSAATTPSPPRKAAVSAVKTPRRAGSAPKKKSVKRVGGPKRPPQKRPCLADSAAGAAAEAAEKVSLS